MSIVDWIKMFLIFFVPHPLPSPFLQIKLGGPFGLQFISFKSRCNFFANRSYIQMHIHNRLAMSAISCHFGGDLNLKYLFQGNHFFSHIVCLYDIYQYFRRHAVLLKPKKVIMEKLYNLSFYVVFALESC